MRHKKIKAIAISYENCEVFSIESKDVKYAYYNGLTTTGHATEYNESLELSEYLKCEEMELRISKEANKIEALHMEENESPFTRTTRSHDIVSVTFYFEDETEKEIYVKWDIEDEYYNHYQKTEINKNGDLIIEIR